MSSNENELQQLTMFSDEYLEGLPVEWPMKPLVEVPVIVQLALPFVEDESVE